MKRKFIKFATAILVVLGVFAFLSCGNSKEEKEEENVQQILPETPAEVTLMTLISKSFADELVSNGKLSAQKMAALRFLSQERIAKIYVKNGDVVDMGQTIASLESFTSENRLKQAKDDLERSKLELQDVLIGQGYKLNDTAKVPTEVMELIKVKSGYSRAKNQYELALFNKRNTVLKAPFKGVVANITSKPNMFPDNSKPFCNVMDLHSMEVSFSVLENEMRVLKKGNKVVVSPYAIPEMKAEGRITEINPWINENGMVEVKASVSYDKRMAEGMNVRVSIFRLLEKQWIVPKTAVVLRTGRQVVFVLKEGKAYWHYVKTGMENATEYTITSETLHEGDKIIVSGNINLAHESPVTVIE